MWISLLFFVKSINHMNKVCCFVINSLLVSLLERNYHVSYDLTKYFLRMLTAMIIFSNYFLEKEI